MDLSDDEVQQRAQADRREVNPLFGEKPLIVVGLHSRLQLNFVQAEQLRHGDPPHSRRIPYVIVNGCHRIDAKAAASQALDVVPTGEGQEYETLPTKLLHAMTEEHGQLPMRLAAGWISIGPGWPRTGTCQRAMDAAGSK
jgi:hypothetical protein